MSCPPFHHPESGRGRVSSVSAARVLRAGRFGLSVLRLVRKDFHQQAWQVELSHSCGANLIGPHKRSISRPKQELGLDERTQQGVARRPIKPPQPLSLRRGQAKARHFNVFTPNATNYLVKRLLLCGHIVLRVREFELGVGGIYQSNAHATAGEEPNQTTRTSNSQHENELPRSCSGRRFLHPQNSLKAVALLTAICTKSHHEPKGPSRWARSIA